MSSHECHGLKRANETLKAPPDTHPRNGRKHNRTTKEFSFYVVGTHD